MKYSLKFWIFGANLLLAGGALGYLLTDNELPYEWTSGTVHPNPAVDGAQVTVCWKLKIRRFCPGTIQRQIIDARDEVHNYDPVPAADKIDVADPFCVTFKLPLGLPAGETRYRVHAAYNCNAIQHFYPIRGTTPEIPFTLILPKEIGYVH